MSDTDDIYFALQSAKQAVESLESWQRRAEARDTVRSMAGEISRGMEAFERLKSQLRDGRQHIAVPEDFKATGCMCSWPNASPPCSWCTDPNRTEEADDAAAQAETAQATPAWCSYCGGAGDVHGLDGEWRGECTECPVAITRTFKNFHANLCKRFGYAHDEKGWQRDLVSLEEHIAKLADQAAQPAAQASRVWRGGGTLTVADLVNNLLMMDQALPIYGAQYIEHNGRRGPIAVHPTVSRERVADGRWIGEGKELNAAVIWTRAEQPAPQAGAATYTAADVTDAHTKGYKLGLAQQDQQPTEQPSQDAGQLLEAAECVTAWLGYTFTANDPGVTADMQNLLDVCHAIGCRKEATARAAQAQGESKGGADVV